MTSPSPRATMNPWTFFMNNFFSGLLDTKSRAIAREPPRFDTGIKPRVIGKGLIRSGTGIAAAIGSQHGYARGHGVSQRQLQLVVKTPDCAERVGDEFSVVHVQKTAGELRVGISEPRHPIGSFREEPRLPRTGLVFFVRPREHPT